MAKYSGGLLGHAYNEVGNFVSRSPNKVDKALRDTIREAADRFSNTSGYEVHAYSGYRPGDPRQHGKGNAMDVALVDKKTGKVLDNYQSPQAFRTYEQFAQTVREVQLEKYPGMDLVWGGYFSGDIGPLGVYGAADLMHFASTGTMLGGSWDEGLTDQQRALMPGAESVGMNSVQGRLPSEVAVPPTREQGLAGALTPEQMGVRPNPMPGGLAAYTPSTFAAENVNRAAFGANPGTTIAGRPEYPGALPAARALSMPAGTPALSLNSMVAGRPEFSGALPAASPALSRPTIGPARENPPSMPALSMPSRPVSPTPARTTVQSDIKGVSDKLSRTAAESVARVSRPAPSARQPAGTPTAGYQPSLAHPQSTARAPRAAIDTAINDFSGTATGGGMLGASMDRNVAAAQQAAQAKAYADYEANRAQAMSAAPAPAIAPSTSKLADAYAQMGQTKAIAAAQPAMTAYEAVRTAPPAPKPIDIVQPPPVLVPPTVPRPPALDYPVAEAIQAPTPPRATAYDVYSGLADTALDNTGQNTVSAMPGGGTSVTNKYGATTGMTPGGYQTAVGSLPGISGPTDSTFGSRLGGAAMKYGAPAAVGALMGGVPGLVGGLLGAAIKSAVQPGGLINNALGGGYAAKGDAIGGLSASQQANARSLDKRAAASGYNRGNSISPRAQAAIDAGVGGLY